jgi:biopolymer transport protein TolR
MDQVASSPAAHPPKKRRRGHHSIEETLAGELNLVPYLDVMVNLIMFLLLTTAAVSNFGLLTLDLQAFASGAGAVAAEDTSLNLTVAITDKGFTVAGRTGVLVKGDGPTIGKTGPAQDQGYDFQALRELLVRISKEFPTEKRAIVFAEPAIPYWAVVKTLDAMRESEEGQCIIERKPPKERGGDETVTYKSCLFPQVQLSATIK